MFRSGELYFVLLTFSQELISILKILKNDYQVTESLLRVGISRRFSDLFP